MQPTGVPTRGYFVWLSSSGLSEHHRQPQPVLPAELHLAFPFLSRILNLKSTYAMPYISVECPSGTHQFFYSIATPSSPEASTIDEKLPVVLFIHSGYFAQEAFEGVSRLCQSCNAFVDTQSRPSIPSRPICRPRASKIQSRCNRRSRAWCHFGVHWRPLYP
jgi:hypothetical protein